MSSHQPLGKQNDTGFLIREQHARASIISHEITGAQGNTLGMLVDQRKSFNWSFVIFDRTGCIRWATGIHGIRIVYKRYMLDTCPVLALT